MRIDKRLSIERWSRFIQDVFAGMRLIAFRKKSQITLSLIRIWISAKLNAIEDVVVDLILIGSDAIAYITDCSLLSLNVRLQ